MIKCPYCGKEYKRIITKHIENHNVNFLKYLEKYEPQKYYEKVVSDFFWEFYRPNPYKFIEQVYSREAGEYVWITKYMVSKKAFDIELEKAQKEALQSSAGMLFNKRKYPLCKYDLIKHLRKERTIGILPYPEDTTFLTFDIDVDNIDYVQRL